MRECVMEWPIMYNYFLALSSLPASFFVARMDDFYITFIYVFGSKGHYHYLCIGWHVHC